MTQSTLYNAAQREYEPPLNLYDILPVRRVCVRCGKPFDVQSRRAVPELYTCVECKGKP